jgi:hypothetical protein
MFEDMELKAPSADEHPLSRTWLWVLTRPITINRDTMLVLDSGEGEFIPTFNDRTEAETFLDRLGGQELEYQVQAMHLLDARKFAMEKSLDLLTLSGEGKVLERWEHSTPLEEPPSDLRS